MEEFDCKKCLHEKVCALWASRESQNASCFCTDGCDYFTPTLTPPNETPPCYQPDGDGCAYQCYDGDDEPIDKCKECPLCYSDKQRHLTPPNEPLTQADLDSMDYDKVWLDYGADGEWALVVSGRIYSLAVLEGAGFEDILRDEVDGETMDRPSGDYAVYRRPPEGEDET